MGRQGQAIIMSYQVLLDRCPHVSTIGMSNDAWLDKRREGIGGSDAGAIMGMSAYGSPLTVYLEKKSLVPRGEISAAAHRGKIIEPVIRAETTKDFPGLRIEPVPAILYDPEHGHYGYMIANIDGVIFAENPIEIRGQSIEGLGGHEIKSAKTKYGWGEDEIPDSYYCQVQHYMKVTGLPWFVVSVYILDNEVLNHYVIRRSEDFIARLVAAEKDFWENYVEKDIMPAPLGIDNEESLITSIFEGGQNRILLGESEKEMCQEYLDLNKAIKELEVRKAAISTNMKVILVQKAQPNQQEKKINAIAGQFSVSWSRYQISRIDTDAMKKAGVYEQYTKKIETGRFSISEGKK